jgi:hypothetical protein
MWWPEKSGFLNLVTSTMEQEDDHTFLCRWHYLHSPTSQLCLIASSLSSSLHVKGHGNEADFLGFSHKSVPHESLTLPFEPFRFLLRIGGDIRNRQTTP